DAARPRTQREHVARTREIRRPRRRIERGLHGGGAVACGNAGTRLSLGLDRHAERRLEPRAVLRHHQGNVELVEPLRRHRQADEAAAVPGHEVDRLWRDFLRRDRQVALVLTVRIVDDDDHLAGANRLDRVLDRRERRGRTTAALGDLDMSLQRVTSPGRTSAKFSPASSTARATYFPTMSHSRLTWSRTAMRPRFVCCIVYGTTWMSKRSSPSAAIVRL